jgi:hypothetical protein
MLWSKVYNRARTNTRPVLHLSEKRVSHYLCGPVKFDQATYIYLYS